MVKLGGIITASANIMRNYKGIPKEGCVIIKELPSKEIKGGCQKI